MKKRLKSLGTVAVSRLVRFFSYFSLVEVLHPRISASKTEGGRLGFHLRILGLKLRIARTKLLYFRLEFRYTRLQCLRIGFNLFSATLVALLEVVRLHLGRYIGEDVVNVFNSSHSGVSVKGETYEL